MQDMSEFWKARNWQRKFLVTGRRCFHPMELFSEIKNRYFQLMFRIIMNVRKASQKVRSLELLMKGIWTEGYRKKSKVVFRPCF